MARLLGVMLPDQSRLEHALTLIYGIGPARSKQIMKEVNITSEVRVKDLTEAQQKLIINYIQKNVKAEGDLREEINDNIKRLKDITSYRGLRHMMGLPVHGQRTKSNSRTRKGKRRTVGALTKEAWAKLEESKKGK